MPITEEFKRAATARETDAALLVTLSISHPSLVQPIRVVNNHENIVSQGYLFVGYPFEITLPDDADTPQQARLSIDNVDRVITDALRAAAGDPPVAELAVIMSSSPDVIQVGPIFLAFGEAEYDAATVTVTLIDEPLIGEPYPGDSVVPSTYPGLF